MDELRLEGRLHKVIIIENDVVKIIKTKGALNTRREKIIPINNIAGVEVKKPGALVAGYIQIQTAGQYSGNSSFTLSGGAYNAVSDENAIVFAKKGDYEKAIKIRDYILSYTSMQKMQPQSDFSVADEIIKLKALLDSNVITIMEFESGKQKLLLK